jgi:hypothetical protein
VIGMQMAVSAYANGEHSSRFAHKKVVDKANLNILTLIRLNSSDEQVKESCDKLNCYSKSAIFERPRVTGSV